MRIQSSMQQILDFIDVFAHNYMDIPKEKSNRAAYVACSSAYKSHNAVRIPLWDIHSTLVIGFNEIGVKSFLKEVATLEDTLDTLIASYDSVKSNMHMNQYFKEHRGTLVKVKGKLFSDALEVVDFYGFLYNFPVDKGLTAASYKGILQEIKEERAK